MSNHTALFDIDPRKIVEVLEGSPSVRLGGFSEEDVLVDDWRRPAALHVNVHAPRQSVTAAIRRKTLQIRTVWLACAVALAGAAALFGFALGRHP